MSIKDELPDEVLDKTQDELKESDEFDYDDEMVSEQEFRDHIGELHETFEVYATSILVSRMFDDGYITLGEYLDIMEYVEEYERDLDATLL